MPILSYTASDRDADIELVLFEGHGEYAIPDNDPVRIHRMDAWDWAEHAQPPYEPVTARTEDWAHRLSIMGDLEDWGRYVYLRGNLRQLRDTFRLFACSLDVSLVPNNYGLGGDDNAYDYHPSAMECLEAFAHDLEELNGKLGEGDFYRDASRAVYEQVCFNCCLLYARFNLGREERAQFVEDFTNGDLMFEPIEGMLAPIYNHRVLRAMFTAAVRAINDLEVN